MIKLKGKATFFLLSSVCLDTPEGTPMSAVPALNVDLTKNVFVVNLQSFPLNNADADLLE